MRQEIYPYQFYLTFAKDFSEANKASKRQDRDWERKELKCCLFNNNNKKNKQNAVYFLHKIGTCNQTTKSSE
jgi:hypothetical protein